MCLAQRPQRSDAGEAQPCSPSVSSQALYHCATAISHRDIHVIKDGTYESSRKKIIIQTQLFLAGLYHMNLMLEALYMCK